MRVLLSPPKDFFNFFLHLSGKGSGHHQPHVLLFKHMVEKLWCVFPQGWTLVTPKKEALEFYKGSSKTLTRLLSFMRSQPNPIYLVGYPFVAFPGIFAANAYYRVKRPAPNLTHAIVNAKDARLVGITVVGPLVYQRVQRFFHDLCIPSLWQ